MILYDSKTAIFNTEKLETRTVGTVSSQIPSSSEKFEFAIWTVEQKPFAFENFSLHINVSIIDRLVNNHRNIFSGTYYSRLFHRGIGHSIQKKDLDLVINVEFVTEDYNLITDVFNKLTEWLKINQFLVETLEMVRPVPMEPQLFVVTNVPCTKVYAVSYLPKKTKTTLRVEQVKQALLNRVKETN